MKKNSNGSRFNPFIFLRNKTNLRRVVAVLASIVVFVSTYAMILPAVALEKNNSAQEDGIFLEEKTTEEAVADAEVAEEKNISEETSAEEKAPEEAPAEETQEEAAANDEAAVDESVPEESPEKAEEKVKEQVAEVADEKPAEEPEKNPADEAKEETVDNSEKEAVDELQEDTADEPEKVKEQQEENKEEDKKENKKENKTEEATAAPAEDAAEEEPDAAADTEEYTEGKLEHKTGNRRFILSYDAEAEIPSDALVDIEKVEEDEIDRDTVLEALELSDEEEAAEASYFAVRIYRYDEDGEQEEILAKAPVTYTFEYENDDFTLEEEESARVVAVWNEEEEADGEQEEVNDSDEEDGQILQSAEELDAEITVEEGVVREIEFEVDHENADKTAGMGLIIVKPAVEETAEDTEETEETEEQDAEAEDETDNTEEADDVMDPEEGGETEENSVDAEEELKGEGSDPEAALEEVKDETQEENAEKIEETSEELTGEQTEEQKVSGEAAAASDAEKAAEEKEAALSMDDKVLAAASGKKPGEDAEKKYTPAAGKAEVKEDDYTISVKFDKNAGLPKETTLHVDDIDDSAESYSDYYEKISAFVGEDATIQFAHFYDLTLNVGEEKVEPDGEVSVSMKYRMPDGVPEGADRFIVHFTKNGVEVMDHKPAKLPEEEKGLLKGTKKLFSRGINAVANFATGKTGSVETAEFKTDGFSTYGVIYTVDFEYVAEDRTYQFSMEGGKKILLSELADVLGLYKDTAFENAQAFAAEVDGVEFSDPALIKVTQIDGDWELESLQPFDTEEKLTITLKNGGVVTVKVTDEQGDGETVTLPVHKKWEDFKSSDYTWTAVFQLQYRERKVGGDGENTAVNDWKNYEPERFLTIHKDAHEQSEVSATFGELPKYVERDGNRYERQYSAEELSFTVWKAVGGTNHVLYLYDGSTYTFGEGADEKIYRAFYDHDANEHWEGDWTLRISNSVAEEIEPQYMNVGLQKRWMPSIPNNASAKFVLKRYVQTEYIDYGDKLGNDSITVQLQDPDGQVLSSVETKSGMNVYLAATFAEGATGTLTFTKDSETYSISNNTASDQKTIVRSTPIPVTGNKGNVIVFTLASSNAADLLADGLHGMQITDRMEGTIPRKDDTFTEREVSFPIAGKTGDEAWKWTFDNLVAEDGEWNADGTQANFNVYSYYLEEVETTPADCRLHLVDTNNHTISADNRMYISGNVIATNTEVGDHIHIEKRWFRLISDQMPPVVVEVKENNTVLTQNAYDSEGNIVSYNSTFGGYILDKNNGWAIDINNLSTNPRTYTELGIIVDGDPANAYAGGHLIPISQLQSELGYDDKHYYFSADGTPPDESTHDNLVGRVNTNAGTNVNATIGTMFIYNIPKDTGYQLEVHKKWLEFNGKTGLNDITSTYTGEGPNHQQTGFVMQIQQRARWKGTETIASEWKDYGNSFEVYKNRNTSSGFEEVIQGQEWLTTIQQRNITKYGYLYNSSTGKYEPVEYDYRLVEVGMIVGDDGRIWTKSVISNTDPNSQADRKRYDIENFEVGKIELQKQWRLEDVANKASEVYYKIYSDWWFSAYNATPDSNGKYDVADIIGRDINNPSLSLEEKALTEAYWLQNGVTVKQVGDLGYVFALNGTTDLWSGGVVRGLPTIKADPSNADKPATNEYGEVYYTAEEVGAWYKGKLVKVNSSTWPYVDPLYYRNTRNQGENRVDNGESFQIDNGSLDYQSYFKAVNSDAPVWKFHAEKIWNNGIPEAGADVVLELQALKLTPEVLNTLTKTEQQNTEGIKVSNLTREQINTLVGRTEGWFTSDAESPSKRLPKNRDYVSMPETTEEERQAKAAAAAEAWSVEWTGLPQYWKNNSAENPEKYELLYRVVETSNPVWTAYSINNLEIGDRYTLSQTITNTDKEDTSGELEITKQWNNGSEAAAWPDDFEIQYKVIQHAYLATVEESTTEKQGMPDADGNAQTKTVKVLNYKADTEKPLFENDNFEEYISVDRNNQAATNGIITKDQNPVTLKNLPKGAMWTAPANESELTDEMKAAGIETGKVYSVAYGYEVVETAVTDGAQTLPFTATSGSIDVNSSSAAGTLINTTTGVKVKKQWKKDGNDAVWPEGYTVGYKVIREIIYEDTKVGEEIAFVSDSTTALSKTDPERTVSGLPIQGIWTATAPNESDAWKSSYNAKNLEAGKKYSVSYTYRVEEATEASEGSVKPTGSELSFDAIQAVFDDTTKAYVITNDLTEVKVVKEWDNYTPKQGDKVGVKLYVSTTAPGQTEKIDVTVQMSWNNGTVAPDSFSVPVTITGVDSKGATVESRNITLTKDAQTIIESLEKYDDYDQLITYTVALNGDPTGDVSGVACGTNTVKGENGTVIVSATGVVPQNTASIRFKNINYDRTITIYDETGVSADGNSYSHIAASNWSSTSISSGNDAVLSGLTPGRYYQIKIGGCKQSSDPGHAVSGDGEISKYEGWGNDNRYTILVGSGETVVSLYDPNQPNDYTVPVSFRFIRTENSATYWGANLELSDFGYFNVENQNVVTKYLPKNTSYRARVNGSWGNNNKSCTFENGENNYTFSVTEEPMTVNLVYGSGDRSLVSTVQNGLRKTSFRSGKMVMARAASVPKTYEGAVTTTTITIPGDTAHSQSASVVGKSGLPHGAKCLTEAEIELSSAVDSTTGAAWSHLWKDLPKTDADGNTLYYYVVETSATVSGSTVRATYDRTEATGTDPVTITITNTVKDDRKYGSLKVTKELTGVTTDNWWEKEFKFTLKDSSGKYLNATTYKWQDTEDGAEFTVKPSTAIKFDHLPLGNYIVTETSTGQELAITAYVYDSVNSVKETAAGGIEVTENNTSNDPAVFKLENKYTPETTEVVVTKAWRNADGTVTAPPNAQVTFELYRSGTEAAIDTITLDGEIDQNGEAQAWVASWTNLPKYDDAEQPYTYSVKEAATNGYGWKHYVVSYPTDGETHKTEASTGDTITNTESTTDLTVDKQWFASQADAAAGSPEKEPTQTTVYYKIMQKLGNQPATVYTYNNKAIQSLTYDSAKKDWNTVKHENLPLKVYVEGSGEESSDWYDATYYVVECDEQGNALTNADYNVTYKKNGGASNANAENTAVSSSDAERTITIINTDVKATVKILKVDARNESKTLKGAEFTIYKKDSENKYKVFTEVGTNGTFKVNDNGSFELNLPNGEYRVVETEAPRGYVITSDSTFYIKIVGGEVSYTDESGNVIPDSSEMLVKYIAKSNTDPATFKVGNTPGAELPMTGGPGTHLFTILGSILIAGAGILLFKGRKLV